LFGLDYRVARVANVYGERQTIHGHQGLVGTVLERMMTGQSIDIYGDGETVRDYVYVADAVAALLLLAKADTPSRVFNVGSGNGASVLEIIRTIEATVGNPASLHFLPERPLDVPRNVLDISRIKAETGWAPRVPLSEGITRTAAWWRTKMDLSFS
jgi:UDP-glucose 4-epimerase